MTALRPIALALLIIGDAQAQSLLPLSLSTEPMHFLGTHWREDVKDQPIKATATLHQMGKGSFGTVVELRIVTSDARRKIQPMQWIITPEGAGSIPSRPGFILRAQRRSDAVVRRRCGGRDRGERRSCVGHRDRCRASLRTGDDTRLRRPIRSTTTPVFRSVPCPDRYNLIHQSTFGSSS